MQALQAVPLLSRLPRVELAKLVSDIQTIELARGSEICPGDAMTNYVYFIYGGKIGVYLTMDQAPVSLMTLGAGEVFGEGNQEETLPGNQFIYRAVEDAILYRLDRSRFEEILSRYPSLLRQFSKAMVQRSSLVLNELARTKSALVMHAAEVWALMEEASTVVQTVVAASAGPAELLPPTPDSQRRFSWSWRQFGLHVLPVLAGLLVFLPGGLQFSPERACLATLVWGVICWLFDSLPDYVVALTIGLVAAVAGIVTPEVAFSGFSHRTWFLLLAVLGISSGISRTGLLYRVALHMLRLFPATYNGQSTALAVGGLVLAPFLPGVTGRQAMASRLSLELGEAMGFKPKSKGAAGLAMACFLGFSCIYYISMTGGSVTLLIWSIFPDAVKASLSWSSWLIAALPVSLVVFGATLSIILRMFRPEEGVKISRDLVESQLRVLGPMNRQEWVTVWVVAAIILAFITQPLHGGDPTWVALPGFLLLCATGILDKEALRKNIDWGFLLLTGGLLGIAAITSQSGFVSMLSGVLVPLIRPVAGNAWLFLTAVAVATSVIHLAVPFQPTILLTALALAPVAGELGYNPFVVGLIILVMASHFVIPHSNPMYMAAYGGSEERAFSHGSVRRLALVHSFVTLIAIWISIPIWELLGLVK